jgi:6-phosphofructokinase 1
VDGLVVIGGNGSQAGSQALVRRGVRVVGVASTIDNDLAGVDVTLGVETAADVAREALDRLRVTAASHERAFLVEVMGRECGYLALISAIAGGAEAFVLPEVPTTADAVVAEVRAVRERGKSHAIVVVAEGARPGADEIAAVAKRDDHLGFELRVTRLGHVQRGGAPGVFDRVLGTRLGVAAVGRLAAGASGELVGLREGKITAMALDSVVGVRKTLDPELVATAKVLQR